MAVPEDRRIFICYVHRDGRDLAMRPQRSLSENGVDAWLDTQRMGGGAVWSTEIEHEIDTRQVMIRTVESGLLCV